MACEHSLFPITLVETHDVASDLHIILRLVTYPQLVSGADDQCDLVAGGGRCCEPAR